jgi:nicotinate-nucleotide pyrophosphorylase (carboxylating)
MTVRLARRITHELLAEVPGRHRAIVSATEPGVVAGTALVVPPIGGESLGTWTILRADGDAVLPGVPLVAIDGDATELAIAEDYVLGVLGMAGGIARRALEIRAVSPPLTVVCGGWKKLPVAVKPVLRAGLQVAGIGHRLLAEDFVYVSKNHVQLLGGIENAVAHGAALDHGPVAVQVTSAADALRAALAGAGVVMVDTGRLLDLHAAHEALIAQGLRQRVRLAFGGGVVASDLSDVAAAGADIVDIGRAIMDAPIWDLRMTIVRT